MKVKLVCIATRKYTQYIDQFIVSAQKYFFPYDDVNVVIFSDAPSLNVGLQQHRPDHYDYTFAVTDVKIPSHGFPEATLLRYRIFSEHSLYLLGSDYVFYADIDSTFVDYVGHDDELSEYIREARYAKLFCTRHPGFWNGTTGSWETNEKSLSYVTPASRAPFYAAGGFVGGSYTEFLNLSGVCSELILGDLRKEITAQWHDESALNKYISCINTKVSFLAPAYVYPEERPDWFTWQGTPRILALKKNHEEIRS